jgi:hypothetical protein
MEVAMSGIRWAILGAAVALLAGRSGDRLTADGQAGPLEGLWVVISVQREGEFDPLQVGAQMTFTGNQVTFQPKVVQRVDGPS